MFVGQHEHSLDAKGRVVLPAPYRASVAARGYVTRLDSCIGLWSEEGFDDVARKWKEQRDQGLISNQIFRKFMTNVNEVKLDSAGRITLPRTLLDELEFGPQVVISGLFDRVEIWPKDKYDLDQSDDVGEELAEVINRLGL